MNVTLAPEPVIANTNGGELFHLTCCDDDLALCGKDVTDYPYTDGSEELRCVVCADLEYVPCKEGCDW